MAEDSSSFLDRHLPIAQLAAAINAPPDALKPALVLVGNYILALLFNLIPRNATTAKHLFSVISSCALFFMLFTLGGFIEMLGMSLITYVACYLGRASKKTPVVVFVYLMAHLSWKFIYNQFFVYSNKKFDNTTPIMVLVIKLTSFAWSAYDGTLPEKDVIPDLRIRAIRRFPSLLEFYGYVFFFGSFLAGPAFDFRDYQMFIYSEGPFAAAALPSVLFPTLKCFLYIVPCLYVYITYSNVYTFMKCTTDEFAAYSVMYRIFIVYVTGIVSRCRYYVAWKLSEGACNLTGLGYTGVDPKTGKHVWDRCQNIDIFGFECAQNAKGFFDSWNQKTTIWLRNCIYYRAVKPGAKPAGFVTLLTYLVSAMWHGFYPGYYLSFTCGAILNLLARTLRRTLRPIFLTPSLLSPLKPLYDLTGWLITYFLINFFVAPFFILKWRESLVFWNMFSYVPLLGVVGLFVGLDVFGGAKIVCRFGRMFGAVYDTDKKKK